MNTLLKRFEYNPLLDITLMNIDYIKTLDYVDILNLRRLNKNFNQKQKFNEILTQILLSNTNEHDKLIIPHKYDVVGALDELYNKIENIINLNYTELPSWVNRDQFTDYMKRRIINGLLDKLSSKFDFFAQKNDFGRRNLIFFKDTISIKINKFLVGIPFIGTNDTDLYFNEYDHNRNILYGVIHKITLSKNIINYIEPSLMNHQNHYSHDILEKLFFVSPDLQTYY